MKILIATALFPPDIADPAPYVKDLATRLAKEHEVHVLLYGNLPEHIAGVSMTTIPKRQFSLFRLWHFTHSLFRLTKQHDVTLVQNAPSTELPAAIVGLFYRHKLQLQMSDQKIVYAGWRRLLHRFTCKRISCIVDVARPGHRPEILPFAERPTDALAAHEKEWETHLEQLSAHLQTI